MNALKYVAGAFLILLAVSSMAADDKAALDSLTTDLVYALDTSYKQFKAGSKLVVNVKSVTKKTRKPTYKELVQLTADMEVSNARLEELLARESEINNAEARKLYGDSVRGYIKVMSDTLDAMNKITPLVKKDEIYDAAGIGYHFEQKLKKELKGLYFKSAIDLAFAKKAVGLPMDVNVKLPNSYLSYNPFQLLNISMGLNKVSADLAGSTHKVMTNFVLNIDKIMDQFNLVGLELQQKKQITKEEMDLMIEATSGVNSAWNYNRPDNLGPGFVKLINLKQHPELLKKFTSRSKILEEFYSEL